MTIVTGQIESLKRIKSELSRNGISRFNSVAEIKSFQKSYVSEKQEVLKQTEDALDSEISYLVIDKIKYQEEYENLKTSETEALNKLIEKLNDKCYQIKAKKANLLIRIINLFRLIFLKWKKSRLEKNFDKIIQKKTNSAKKILDDTNNKIKYYTENREKVISERSSGKLKELDQTKAVVDSLYPQIAGAIGENKVVKELSKLSDKYYHINDFSIEFERPIYNKNEKDRIFSIQIDHLLITNSGVFIIETKNWSQDSIDNLDLRSPVEQIRRSNYALFVILNSNSKPDSFSLNRHHWGEKQIPIRNLIVMINNKPTGKFKYVEVKTLKELNSYINFFEPVLDDTEVKKTYNYLNLIRR